MPGPVLPHASYLTLGEHSLLSPDSTVRLSTCRPSHGRRWTAKRPGSAEYSCRTRGCWLRRSIRGTGYRCIEICPSVGVRDNLLALRSLVTSMSLETQPLFPRGSTVRVTSSSIRANFRTPRVSRTTDRSSIHRDARQSPMKLEIISPGQTRTSSGCQCTPYTVVPSNACGHNLLILPRIRRLHQSTLVCTPNFGVRSGI